MWVTEIRLKNYRAFTDEVVVKIPKGHHLLVYGENGSGKSSLFRGLQDVLASNVIMDYPYSENRWNADEEAHTIGRISLTFNHSVSHYQSNQFEGFIDADRSILSRWNGSDFLSYKSFVPLNNNRQEAGADDQVVPDTNYLFQLITEELLTNTMVTDVTTKGAEIRFRDLIDRIHLELHRKSQTLEVNYTNQELLEEITFDLFAIVDNLNDTYYDKVAEINLRANDLLSKYFESKVVISVIPDKFTLSRKSASSGTFYPFELKSGRAFFQPFFAGKKFADYQDHLNEARINSFLICFRLAAILVQPVDSSINRLLFLDDIFTGLDMNNRLPLLKLIKSEFMEAEIAAFQVGIATHDRNWYELAKYWFDQRDVKVKYVEMYTERSKEPLKPDKPVIITEDLTYYDKAIAYFRAKDYPSTANLLRKESENLIRKILPSNKRQTIDDKSGKIKQDTSLESLLKKLSRYLESAGFDTNPIFPFETYKKIVLNPLSHDDLNAPHYRSELEQTFNMVDFLKSVFVREVEFSKDKPIGEASLDFGYVDREHNNQVVKHQIFPRQTLRYIKLPNQDGRFMPCECRLVIANIETKYDSLNKAISKICEFEDYTIPANFEELYKHFKVTGSYRLNHFTI